MRRGQSDKNHGGEEGIVDFKKSQERNRLAIF